jgi:erythromycin esterase-like protein
VKPIRSLFSDDARDLEFLKPLLAGKRVVQLGESAHGVAEFSWLKVRLAKYLHRELGFDVIAFESPVAGCDRGDALVASSAVEAMRACLYDVWHTEEVLPLFEYVAAERAAGRRLAIAGFDVQERGQAMPPAKRDAGMADQLDALLDTKFAGRKVVVWAHNFHVAKDPARDMARTMGNYVAERRGREVYTVGLYMGRGVGAQNNRTLYEIKRAPDNSLEAILASAGYRYAFADLSAARKRDGSWMDEVLVAREWGAGITRIVPSRSFDGVIYIDAATPPRYR